MALFYIEENLDERLKTQKARALKVLARQVETTDDLEEFLTYYLSQHYRIPTFHDCWTDLSIDDKYYEFELVTGSMKPAVEVASDALKANPVEAASLFDDWATVPPKPNDIDKIAQDFIKSGNFPSKETSK